MGSQPAMKGPTVSLASDATGAAWDSFVATTPGGSFYHRFGWKALNERHFGHLAVYLEAREGTTPTGVLPLVLTRSRIFGRILCSMPFVNYGGPIATDEATTRQLVEAALQQAARLRADYLELRCHEPFATSMKVATHKISMTLALEPDPEQLWSRFSSKHRTAIRRVYKDGLSVVSGGHELLPEFYAVMQRSWRDLGTPLYSPRYFEAIMREFPAETRVFVCRRGGDAIAVAFNGYFAGKVEGMWAGVTRAGHALNANYVLYWEMIKDACERGFRRYHLGRSTAGSGAELFKKKWNAEPSPLYWYYHFPDGAEKNVVNVKHPSFKHGIAAWRRLPLWATRLIGPGLARVIP